VTNIFGEDHFVDVRIIARLKASEHSDRAVLLVLRLPIWHSPLDHFSGLKVCVPVFDVVGDARRCGVDCVDEERWPRLVRADEREGDCDLVVLTGSLSLSGGVASVTLHSYRIVSMEPISCCAEAGATTAPTSAMAAMTDFNILVLRVCVCCGLQRDALRMGGRCAGISQGHIRAKDRAILIAAIR